jgi:hypothetical protein
LEDFRKLFAADKFQLPGIDHPLIGWFSIKTGHEEWCVCTENFRLPEAFENWRDRTGKVNNRQLKQARRQRVGFLRQRLCLKYSAKPGCVVPSQSAPKLTATQFEALARHIFSQHFGAQLQPGNLSGVPKLFDLVSADGRIAGDAKYFTLVGGQHLLPAKFSIIAEHVWLLEKTGAANKFLVFGNDIEVPKRWLDRYGICARMLVFTF